MEQSKEVKPALPENSSLIETKKKSLRKVFIYGGLFIIIDLIALGLIISNL